MTTDSHDQVIAQKRNQALRDSFRSTRFWYVVLSIASGIAAAVLAFLGLWLIALCLFVTALVCLSQHFDAVGNLHDIEARPNDKLIWSDGPDRGSQGASSHQPTPGTTTGHMNR